MQYELRGLVKDAGSQKPIAALEIRALEAIRGRIPRLLVVATADARGRYQLVFSQADLQGNRANSRIVVKVTTQGRTVTGRSLGYLEPGTRELEDFLVEVPGGSVGDRLVHGTVTDVGGAPVEGITVRVFELIPDKQPKHLNGAAQSDVQGSYHISYSSNELENPNDSAANLMVRAYDADGSVVAEVVQLDAQVDQLVNLQLETDGGRSVFGTVTDGGGAPVEGLAVRVFELGPDTQLNGDAQSDAQGYYYISYASGELENPNDLTTDLVVRAYTADGSVVGEIEQFEAGLQQRIDLHLELPTTDYTLSGKLTDQAGLPLGGLIVQAFDDDPTTAKDFLGFAISDEQGQYQIKYTEEDFVCPVESGGPDLIVRVYSPEGELLKETFRKPDSSANETINVKNIELEDPDMSEVSYTIEGHVVDEGGAGVSGIVVQLYEQGIPGAVKCRNSVGPPVLSAWDGAYRIEIPHNALYLGDKAAPDFVVRASDRDGNALQRVTVYNASAHEEVNLVLDEDTYAGESEFDQLSQTITDHLGGKLTIAEVDEVDGELGISYVARKTTWDARLVAMNVLAHRKAEASQVAESQAIPAGFYYALFRAGVYAGDEQLYRVPAADAVEIYAKAIESNVVPDVGASTETIAALFKGESASHILQSRRGVAVSTVDEILAVSLGNDAESKAKFVETYYHTNDDIDTVWQNVEAQLGKNVTDQLKLDGKLGFLTFNSASLMSRLRQQNVVTSDLVELVQNGLYKAAGWESLIDEEDIPGFIEGEDVVERRTKYTSWITGQLKLAYPTAVVAEEVKGGGIPLNVSGDSRDEVYAALYSQDDGFQLGRYSMNQHLANLEQSGVTLTEESKDGLRKLHRTFQTVPTFEAMGVLIEEKLDSAYHITRYKRSDFIQRYSEALGGEAVATQVHDKASMNASLVTNMTLAYLTQAATPVPKVLGAPDSAASSAEEGGTGGSVKSYPTIDNLFGALDFCTCNHCESVLSPAAYLVALLQFIDLSDKDLGNGEGGSANPFEKLIARRPDIEHLELSCENTLTTLPYVDLANEIMEYFVVHSGLDGFEGFNLSADDSAEDLAATPQNVSEAAYDLLRTVRYPFTAPFNRNLALARAFLEQLDAPLYQAMETLRKGESLIASSAEEYAWREIFWEQLGLSTEEAGILTDHTPASIQAHFGLKDSDSLQDTIGNAEEFCRRTEIEYEDLVTLLATRFVNPNARILSRLEGLQAVYAKAIEDASDLKEKYGDQSLIDLIHDFVDGEPDVENDFDRLFPPTGYDAEEYGGDLRQWMSDAHETIKGLIFLVPEDASETCSFSNYWMRYGDRDHPDLADIEYWKLMRFIRLANKVGWPLEQTDRALSAFYDHDAFDLTGGDLTHLDGGFEDLLVKIALFERVRERLGVKESELDRLLALWGDLDTGDLYTEIFLDPTLPHVDEAFEADPFGEYLTDSSERLLDHSTALKAAFQLTDDDWDRIVADLTFDENTELSLGQVTRVFRYSFLSSSLQLAATDLIDLKEMSGVDPFAEFQYSADNGSGDRQYTEPSLLRFLAIAQEVDDSDFSVQDVNYLVRHLDQTGTGQPAEEDIRSFARLLNNGMRQTAKEYPTEGGLTEEQATGLLAAIYGVDAANTIQAMLSGVRPFEVEYAHGAEELEQEILDADTSGRLFYDNYSKRLRYTGLMTESQRDAFQAVPGASAEFQQAVDDLHQLGLAEFESFLNEYPEFRDVYETKGSLEEVVSAYLTPLLQELMKIYLHQTLSEELKVDSPAMDQLLRGELESDFRYVMLDVAGENAVIEDFLQLSKNGVSADFYNGDDLGGAVIESGAWYSAISFGEGLSVLPDNTDDPALNISAVWRFLLEAPTNEYYNFSLECDLTAEVTLRVEGEEVALQNEGGTWRNQEAILLEAGRLYAFELEARKVKDSAVFSWQRVDKLHEVIPSESLIPWSFFQNYRTSYLRLLKAVRLVEGLGLSAEAVNYLAGDSSLKVKDAGLFHALPTESGGDQETYQALFASLSGLLDYAALLGKLGVSETDLIDFFRSPAETDTDGTLRLFLLTQWVPDSFGAVMERFTEVPRGELERQVGLLTDRGLLNRACLAMTMITDAAISGETFLEASTPFATNSTLQALQNQVRAKFNRSTWLEAIQAIHDALRREQRDALVSYLLSYLQEDEATNHIDTGNKLFEYLLIDPLMDPCMQTSRVKQAISTVQLFIHRCLMNLEDEVDPSCLDASQWEWMKRYRVWEANLKVFLFPENWLDASLRNTKSPLFREFEGELLQSDIDDDRATAAYLAYLEKLDRIAQLDVCGMCREDEERIHVIGRTAGTAQKYYHRTYNGTWSAWEEISLDIEDGPVVPVFWQGRLFLFWTTIVIKGEQGEDFDPDAPRLVSAPPLVVEVSICYSEFYNGKWQPKQSSDLEDPIRFKVGGAQSSLSQPASSQSSNLFFNAQTEATFTGSVEEAQFHRKRLVLEFRVGDELAVHVNYERDHKGAFYLKNKHALPELSQSASYTDAPLPVRVFGSLGSKRLGMDFYNFDGLQKVVRSGGAPATGEKVLSHVILGQGFHRECDFSHMPEDVYNDPFFCSDHEHTFFVELEKGVVNAATYPYLGMESREMIPAHEADELWRRTEVPVPGSLEAIPIVVSQKPGHVTLSLVDEVLITRAETTALPFMFGSKQIGVTGSLD